MRWEFAHIALLLAFAYLVEAYVEIPDDLKNGKMRKYPACQALFSQTEESYAIVKDHYQGPYNKVCNCSYTYDPPQSGLSIRCTFTREVVVPIALTSFQHLRNVAYFIIKYRIKDSTDQWQEQRIEYSRRAGSAPVANIDLDFENGISHIYIVKIYAILSDNSRQLIITDEISSSTGASVIALGRPVSPADTTRYHTQKALDFSMQFNEITDKTIKIYFESADLDSFRVEYIQGGRKLRLSLDADGRATLRNLQPDTKYTFIVYYLSDGDWAELKRHSVATLPEQRLVIQNPNTVIIPVRQDISLECPVVPDAEIEGINWYRVRDDGQTQLLATYDENTGETSYPPGSDPTFEVIEGRVLKIKNAGREYAGRYRCRLSVLGTGYQWQSVRIARPVRAYVTWRPAYGVTSYYIQYRPETEVSGSWQYLRINTTRSSAIIGNLQPLTTYVFQIFDYTGNTRGRMIDTVTVKTITSSEEDFQFCDSTPCLNNGVCNEIPGGYQCLCRGGFSGENCEIVRSPCDPNPCQNRGVCRTGIGGTYSCICSRGYTGPHCSTAEPINPCENNPCVHGRCYASGVNYNCQCEREFRGKNCDQRDTGSSFLLRCPIRADYGNPRLIRWYRVQGQRHSQIYTYDAVAQSRIVNNPRYNGRLSSPSSNTLIIHNAEAEDVGTYYCSVSYRFREDTPPEMQITQVPSDDTRLSFTWLPSPLYIDHYKVKYRNIYTDDEPTEVQVPPDDTRYTLRNLEPSGAYEIYVIPYTRSGNSAQPLSIRYVSPDSPTTTTTEATTTVRPRSRGDSGPEKTIDDIPVNIMSLPIGPYSLGSTVLLNCLYQRFSSGKRTVLWKKDGEIIDASNPSPRNNLVIRNERQLVINNFQASDVGTYSCVVEYDLPTAIKYGEGSIVVTALQELPPPRNLQIKVTGSQTAVLTWQSPGHYALSGYNIIYYPTTRSFGEYERKQVGPYTTTITLTDLVEGMEYHVQVIAVDHQRYSTPLEKYFIHQVVKVDAPTNYRIQMLSDTQARVSWDQEDQSGITGYKVQYWDVAKPANSPNLVIKDTTSRDVVLDNLSNGKTYQVWIQAKKGEKLSPQLSRQFTKSAARKPNPPTVVTFTDIENDRMTVSWGTPVGWTTDTKYRVHVESRDSNHPFSLTYPDSAPNTKTLTSLKPGLSYLVTVQSIRDGVLSNPVYGTAKTMDLIKLSAPYPDLVTLRCKTLRNSYVYQVQWFKVDAAGREKLIYTAYPSSSGKQSAHSVSDTQFTGRLASPSVMELNVTNVRYPMDFGKYKCTALSGTGRESDVIELAAEYPERIEPPYAFGHTVLNSTAVRISWLHPYAEDITSYVVTYGPTVSYLGPEKTLEVDDTFAILTDLIPSTDYSVTIKSKIERRKSDDSLAASFIGLADHVNNVQVTRLPDGNDLRITWENPEDNEGVIFALRQSEEDEWNEQPAMSQDTSSRRIRYPLKPGQTLFFKISSLKNNVATPVIVEYTEKEPLEESERIPDYPDVDVTRPTDRRTSYPPSVLNLRLESRDSGQLSAWWDDTPVQEFDYYSVVISNTGTGLSENFNVTQPYLEVILEPSETYEVAVSTVYRGLTSQPVTETITLRSRDDETAPELEPISAPTNLRFSNVMRSRFTVQWDSDDSSATEFEIRYRPTNSDEEWNLVLSNDYQITIRGVNEGTQYEVAVNALSETGRSEAIEGTVRTQMRRINLSRPKVNIIGRTNDSFSVRFGDSNTAHQITVVLAEDTSDTQVFDVEQGRDTFTVTGLQAGKHYRFSVARTSNGRLGKSTRKPVTTNPNQPKNLEATEVLPNSITLTWDEPDSDEITGYNVFFSPESTNGLTQLDTVTNTVELTDLEPNTRYEIQIRSKQGHELSTPTKLSLTTTQGIQPVGEVTISDLSENSAIVEWVPPRTRALYTYEVKMRPVDDANGWLPMKTTSENWILFNGLNPATEYVVEVTSVLGDERSEPVSKPIRTNVPITDTLHVPTSPHGGQPVEISWDVVEDAEAYNVTYYPVSGAPQFMTVDGKKNSILLEDLQPETEYVVHVTAFMNGVEGSPNTVKLVTGPVAAPTDIEFQPSNGVMQVNWDDVNADQYEITYHPVGDSRYPVTRVVSTTSYNITNIEPGEYEITVTSIKSGHRSPPTTVTQSIGVKPPEDIEFTDATDNGFVVMWNPSSTPDVVNYVVRVKPVDSTDDEYVDIQTEDNFITLNDLEPGTAYIVQITANTPDEESEPLTSTVTTEAPSPDYVVSDLGEEDGSVVVFWEPVTDADSYRVTYYPAGTSQSSFVVIDKSQNQTILNNLRPDTEYIVEVTALVNDVVSQPVETIVTTPLQKPKDTSVEPVTENDVQSSSAVQITWDDENAAPVYEVRYYTVSRDGENVNYGEPRSIFVPGSNGGTVLSDLLPATEYVIEVVATDGTKESKPQIVSTTTPLDQPDGLDSEPEEDEVTLRWTPSNGKVTQYRVDLIPSDGSQTITVPVDGRRHSVTVTGLQPGTEYEVHVTAVNNELSVESAPVISKVETNPADVKPVNANLRKLPNGTYVVTWSQPATPVSYYVVHYQATNGTPSENIIQIAPDLTTLTLPELVPDTEYQIEIQGVRNPGDDMGEHNTVIRRIKTDVPSMSGPVTIAAVTDEYVELVWDAPAGEKYLTGYRVELFPTGSNRLINAVEVARSSNMASMRGLQPDTNYTVRVTPHINFHPGKPAFTTFVTDHTRVVPSPEFIEADDKDTEQLVIRWEPPPNHDLITSYEVLVESEDGDVSSYEVQGDASELVVTDLNPGTTYDVTLISYVDDNPGESVTATISTLPEAPRRVGVKNALSDQLEVIWEADDKAETYFVSVFPLYDASAEAISFETEQARVLIPDLLPNTTYHIDVIAISPNGEESRPSELEIATIPALEDRVAEVPVKPEGSLSFIPYQSDITISWNSLNDVPVDAYQVFYRAPGEPTKMISVPSFVNETILSSLEPEKIYDVWVVGLLPFGENAPVTVTDHHTVTIIPSDNYEPLTDEPVVAPQDGRISIKWEPLGPDVSLYGVNYTNLDTGLNYQTVVPGTYSETLLSGLNPGDDYVIQVMGIENGAPIRLDNVNVGTSDFVIDENAVQAISPTGRFSLQWSHDSEDDERIIGYTINYERKCCLGEPDLIWIPGQVRSTVLDLEPNTEYVFQVHGKTADGIKIPVPDVVTESLPVDEVVERTPPVLEPTFVDGDVVTPGRPIATRTGPSPVTTSRSRTAPMGGTERPLSTTASTTRAQTQRTFSPRGPEDEERTKPSISVVTRTSPVLVTLSTRRPNPLDNNERTDTTRQTLTTKTFEPTPTLPGHFTTRTTRATPRSFTTRTTRATPRSFTTRTTPATPPTTPSTTPTSPHKTPGVDALPTLDGNILVSWAPTENPDRYILQYEPKDNSFPVRTINIPADETWSSIPEPTTQSGYEMTIYSVENGSPEPIYDVQLGRSPTDGGFVLRYKPSSTGDSHSTITESTSTEQVFIPADGITGNLPDTEYTLRPDGDFTVPDEDYVEWLKPIVRQGGTSRSVTVRWNPDRTNITETRQRIRVELVPINNPRARTIRRYFTSDSSGIISGLLPGVSYRLYARYMQSGVSHRSGDIATQFVVPAFTSQGTQVTQRLGIQDVWMKQLPSGDLFLQWKNYPGATSYTIEDRELPDGILHRSTLSVNNRWLVLPQLRPGGVYSINIFATVGGSLIKIYTVTVTRKITAPPPPSKIEWYNMFGNTVDLSWLPPQTPITGYRITYRLDEEDSTPFVVDLPGNTTTYHMSGLEPGKTYLVTIQTLRNEQISREFTFTLRMNIPQVQKLLFRQSGPDTIIIDWPPLPDYVTGYLIQVRQVSPIGPDLVTDELLSPDQTEYTIQGVKPSYRYEFIIQTLIEDAESDPLTLQLWTLRQDSQISRVERTGTWTVSWTGEPLDVDHWKIEVRRKGSQTVLQTQDNIDRSMTSFDFNNLPLGQEYIVSIYGVKGDVVSTPIQVFIPSHPQLISSSVNRHGGRPSIEAVGRQLVERISVKRQPDRVQILLFPVTEVDDYIIEYRIRGVQEYSTDNVEITSEQDHDLATVSNLLPEQVYEFKITAIQGRDRSSMVVEITTPRRYKTPLQPLRDITREEDLARSQLLLRWSVPNVRVREYIVKYTYTEAGQEVTRTVRQPFIYVPKISLGHSATFRLGYVAQDNRRSPDSILKISYGANRVAPPREDEIEQS